MTRYRLQTCGIWEQIGQKDAKFLRTIKCGHELVLITNSAEYELDTRVKQSEVHSLYSASLHILNLLCDSDDM